jgi:hypothetical protein
MNDLRLPRKKRPWHQLPKCKVSYSQTVPPLASDDEAARVRNPRS